MTSLFGLIYFTVSIKQNRTIFYLSQINNYAANILVALLFGRLNMPAHVWQSLIHSISPTLPVLQCFASVDKALERGLAAIADASNTMLTSDGRSYLLPPLEQLRASLRFMFVKSDHIRARGFSSVIWTLAQEDSNEGKPARFCYAFRILLIRRINSKF